MDEYIKRDAVIQQAFSAGLCDASGNIYGTGDIVLVDDILNIPAADVAPVVHGRWKQYHESDFGWDEYGHTCSNCGIRIESGTEPCAFHYCPHCGAKMDLKG